MQPERVVRRRRAHRWDADINKNCIEPVEIERVMTAFAGVDEAKVVAVTRGSSTSLVGFVVAKAGATLNSSRRRSELRMLLPVAIALDRLIELPQIPRLRGGKVNLQRPRGLAAAT